MALNPFDRDPYGWIHPFYRRPHRHHYVPVLHSWGDFVQPALETVDTLNRMLHLIQPDSLLEQGPQQASDKFEVKVDVKQFAPNEIQVKMVDNSVVIEGKHEEKQDEHGFVSRHFVRRYQLPDDVKPETVVCNVSSDGLLTVTAPRMLEEKKQANERSLQINFTGQPAVGNAKPEENKEKGQGDNKGKSA